MDIDAQAKALPAAEPSSNYRGVFDHRLGFGSRPALVIVDFVRAYTTPGSPLYAPAVSVAIEHTATLLAAARAASMKVCFTRVIYNSNHLDGGLFVQKIPALRTMVEGAAMAELVQDLAVMPEDLIVTKQYASAFFGTSLASSLHALRVDTLILAGCSTSGCIRATAVDGMQHGYRVIVPRECVADRHDSPHHANLFDINAKYGDVVSLTEVLSSLKTLDLRQGAAR